MKAVRIFSRNVRDSFKSVFRNFSLSLASISCITITLIVVSISIILSLNVDNFTSLVEKDVTIVAFLDAKVTEDRIKEIEVEINHLNGIENVIFQSKKDISNEMSDASETYKNILDQYTDEENPLQDTYLIKVKDIEEIGKIADQIKKIQDINIVKYGEGMVEQLVSVFDIVRKVSIVIVGALIVVTAFLITNTIKITITARKREIEIMRLVGASNINIRVPFIFEGLFLGVIGSVIPILVTTYGYVALYSQFNGQLFSPFIKLVTPTPFIYYVSGILLVIGIVVGMFGSLVAVRKYLKI